jgi:hypothetical protein
VFNGTRYALEWIAFHRLQGVQRFHIYDDSLSSELEDSLAPYIRAGIVELRHLDHLNGTEIEDCLRLRKSDKTKHPHFMTCQPAVFSDCLGRARTAGDRWIGTFDLDEYMFAKQPLFEVLDGLGVSHVGVHGVVFGPGPFLFSNWSGLVTQTHLQRAPLSLPAPADLLAAGGARKSFVRTDQAIKLGIHDHQFHGEGVMVSSITMHHYQYLSFEESLEKASKNANENYNRIQDPRFQIYLNYERDESALRFGDLLAWCLDRLPERIWASRCFIEPDQKHELLALDARDRTRLQ